MIEPGKVEITAYCHLCKSKTTFLASKDGFEAWRKGELIQRALPELDRTQRELMISGTCPNCFDKMFAEDEDEEG